MRNLSRVVWSEGMYIAPHHFQAQNRYFEDSVQNDCSCRGWGARLAGIETVAPSGAGRRCRRRSNFAIDKSGPCRERRVKTRKGDDYIPGELCLLSALALTVSFSATTRWSRASAKRCAICHRSVDGARGSSPAGCVLFWGSKASFSCVSAPRWRRACWDRRFAWACLKPKNPSSSIRRLSTKIYGYPNDSRLSLGPGRPWPGQWTMDYPRSDRHLLQGVRRLTRIDTRSVEQVVSLDGTDDIYNWPCLYAVEVGHWLLPPAQARQLREYLLRGGFLMVDDFHGSEPYPDFLGPLNEWETFTRSMT